MRRVAAIVLPRLPSELVRLARASIGNGPLAVVVTDDETKEASGAAIVGAVDDAAARLGVRVGERVSEAMARSSELTFAQLSPRAIDEALACGAVACSAPSSSLRHNPQHCLAYRRRALSRRGRHRDEIYARYGSCSGRRAFRGTFLRKGLARYAAHRPPPLAALR